MEYGAIDLHKKTSEVRIVNEAGTVVSDQRIATTREAFTRIWSGRPRMRMLFESSTESEWVAQHLESLGHEVIVADPNYLPMYGQRSRRIKTDRRDVAALAEACRLGIYRRAHRVAAATRALRQRLRTRRLLVAQRSAQISLLRAVLRQEGLRLASGSADQVVRRLDRLALPAVLTAVVAPLRAALETLTRLIDEADAQLHETASHDEVAQRLMSAPGVGPVVALTYRATLDDVQRFGGQARRVSAFLGLVPSEASSAERRQQGHITHAGPNELRALLVQASWVLWRSKAPGGAALRAWAHALAARRGRRVAIVALARRLARILYALWRDETEFTARRTARPMAA